MLVTLLFATFAVCLVLGVPVGIALGLSAAVYLVGAGIDLSVVPQYMFAGMDSFVLLCIPGFVLAGNLMNGGGITDQIVRFGNAIVGHVRGGLGLVTAAASTVGPIIPPSVPMIIVGTLTGLSVGKMFLAGAVPGLLLGLGMMIT